MANPTWHNIHADFKLNGIVLTKNQLVDLAGQLAKEGQFFEKVIGDFLLDWISNEPTVQVQTSGSTGKPKTIVLKKEQMVNSALATGAYFQLRPGQKALLCLPCTGIAGKMMLVRAMVLGLHLDSVEPASNPMSSNNQVYDFVAMVPLQVQNSLDELHRINQLIIGGAPVDVQLRSKLTKLAVQAYETYGMTETITHIAVKKLGKEESNYFEALPNVKLSVDDRGCLIIDAPKVASDKVVTNDLVELVNDKHFKWLGRYDSIINSGGIKLMPEKIEVKLSKMINNRFFVAGLPDETLGQKLVLVVESGETDASELLQNIKNLDRISKYEIPKQVFFVKSFMETSTKKVDRQKTLEQIN